MVKRKDFNATLKQLTDCLERMCSGSWLHSDGAATANERAPNFTHLTCKTICPVDSKCRRDDRLINRSAKGGPGGVHYLGLSPLTQ